MYYENEENNNLNDNNEIEISTVQISEKIDEILSVQNFKELSLLKERLLAYKKEVDDKVKYNKPIEHELFKQNLNEHLEKLLLFAIYIPNLKIRDDKIRQVYRWYFEKLVHWESLDKIRNRTDKNPDEIYEEEVPPSDRILIQDENYELEQFKLHRTEIKGLEPPKDRLKEYKKKNVNPPKKFKKSEKKMADLRFNIDRFKGRVGTENNVNKFKNEKFATKTGKVFSNNFGIDNINIKKEIKSGYSFNRPEYEHVKLVVEKEIIQAKNKELAEKKNQEEIKIYLEDFGKAKAKFNEKKEIKNNLVNIVKYYETTFKPNKNAEDIINEEEKKEKENLFKTQQRNNLKYKGKYIDNTTNLNNKIVYTRIENLPKKDESDPKKKISQNSLINLNNNKLNEENSKKKNIKIELNPTKQLNLDYIKQQQQKTNLIKIDTLPFAKVNDRVLNQRLMSAKICNVKEIDIKKDGYTYHCNPLSAFDELNYNTYKYEAPQKNKKLNRPRTASEFASKHYKNYENNLLELRFKMNEFNHTEVDNLKNICFQKTNYNKNENNKEDENIFKGEINPTFNNVMDRPKIGKTRKLVFFPRPESALLPKPPEIGGKKKKRPKSKKKF